MNILFIGNRPLIKEICQKYCYTKVIDTPKGCNKKKLLEDIESELEQGFDILVSNGCPYLLPVSELKIAGQFWINIHPAYLPEYKGTNPIREMHQAKCDYVAATCHHMDDGMDSGAIIYQEKKPFKGSLDERYKASFALEAEVFKKAIRLI
jgi:methionyl-tRNA formyltransferase